MQIIEAYIEYLRNVSRKIISRSGFINVLPTETNTRFNFFNNIDIFKKELIYEENYVINSSHKLYKYLKLLNNYLDSNSEYKLFIGTGIIHGNIKGKKKNTYICAPLLYSIVDYEKVDNNFTLDIDLDSTQLNHDLISRIFDLDIEEDSEEELYIPDHILEKFNNIEESEACGYH